MASSPTNANQDSPRERSRWQFGLSSLLLMVMVLGPVLGLGVPLLVRLLIEHPVSPAPRVPPTFPRDYYESGFYYESAETPLD